MDNSILFWVFIAVSLVSGVVGFFYGYNAGFEDMRKDAIRIVEDVGKGK